MIVVPRRLAASPGRVTVPRAHPRSVTRRIHHVKVLPMEVPEESLREMASRHVHEGEEHIAKQKALIAELERDGHLELLPAARELLKQFEESQALHREHAGM